MKVKSESEVAQSCPTLCNPMDWSPPGSSVHGIFQARVLEWGAIAFSDIKHKYMLLEGERDLTRDSGEGWQSSFSWPEWCLKGYLPYNNLNNNSNYTLVLQGFLCLYFNRMKSFFFLNNHIESMAKENRRSKS